MNRITTSALGLLVLLSACASGHRTSETRADRNLITATQIRDGHFQNAYDAVEALRPNWLSPRGPDSFNTPSQIEVYYDATHLGAVGTLRNIEATTIEFIRWYDGTQAQQRFGIGHSAGVIFVSSRSD